MNTTTETETQTPTHPKPAARWVTPRVNIFEGKDGYTVEAEMPGVNKDGLEITIEGTELTIVGRRDRSGTKAEVLYRESGDADFQRAFELDPAVDAARIEAKMEQGMLTLHLPKSEKAKPRKIPVSA